MTVRWRFRRLGVIAVACAVWATGFVAQAAGVRGSGSAQASEWKSPPKTSTLRARAIRRARLAALQAAIDGLQGPVDAASKKAALRDGSRWTGAYRILGETVDPSGVSVQLEVDIDIARLAKFLGPVAPPTPASARYHLGSVEADEGCDVERAQLLADLEQLGFATEPVGRSAPVAIDVHCEVIGPVPNTLLQAVRVRAETSVGGRVVVRSDAAGFGVDDGSARERAAGSIADEVSTHLLPSAGGVQLRVESPHPASRIRRLERALAEQVSGVRSVSVSGIDPDGAVRLRVQGRASADAIARGLQALSLPDFSITIVGIHDARGLTIRLR